MKEDLKILNMEYLSNHQLDLPQIVNLSLGDQTKFEIAQNEDDLQCKTTSTFWKWNISATTDWILLKY